MEAHALIAKFWKACWFQMRFLWATDHDTPHSLDILHAILGPAERKRVFLLAFRCEEAFTWPRTDSNTHAPKHPFGSNMAP